MVTILLRVSAILLLCTGLAVAQNIVPNPGFETRTSCPSSIGHFDGFVSTWQRSTGATTDYSGCGYTGNGVINNVPANGQSSIGGWGGASHPSCPGNAYIEGVRANLTQAMTPGLPYEVRFRVRVDPTGSSTAGPNNCVDFGVYLYNAAAPPTQNGWCCLNVTPQVRLVGSAVPQGGYLTYTDTVVAGPWNAIIVGPFCNANTNSGPCSNYSTARMYFNLDDVSVQQVTVLDAEDLQLSGQAHAAFNALQWEVSDPGLYQTFALERSLTGSDFTPVREQLSDPAQHLYQYLDQDPAPGLSFYRLVGRSQDGEVHTSSVVSLMRDERSGADGGELQLFYDEAGGTLQFALDAGEGGLFQLEMVDLQGRILLDRHDEVGAGRQQFILPVDQVAQGVYLLRVRALNRNAIWQSKWVR